MENVDELNKKIVEWLGWKPKGNAYVWPDGRFDFAPKLTTSLDACFEHIVPKLAEDGRFCGMIMATPNKKLKCRFTVDLVEGDSEGVEAEAETAALALCRAVEKLIDGECEHNFVNVVNKAIPEPGLDVCTKCGKLGNGE